MKQTAVEWLAEQIEQYILTYGNLPFNVLSKLKKQAKMMEKEQIIDAYDDGSYKDFGSYGEQYYNQTYMEGKE